ncbi:MAG: hypothetical protein GX569_07710 [Candidatus Riflebacteria bacterium]|nr:hypothetical protein [Candidatus Riflebacteria bacterium]
MKNGYRNRKNGITLTEIMLATILMAVAILPIVGIFSQGHKLTQKDMRRIDAIHLAESSMNKLLKLPYDQVPVGTLNNNLVAASGTIALGNVKGEGNATYTISLTVSNYPVTFAYHPVDLNDASYNIDKSETWKFLDETTEGAVFDGSGVHRPIMVKQYDISVSWTEPNNIAPPPIQVSTLKANLEE